MYSYFTDKGYVNYMLISAPDVAWTKHLGAGICSDGYLNGDKDSTQSQCQEKCAKDADCKFYCHGSRNEGTWNCFRYSICPTLNQVLHGKDTSSYSCYEKPGEIFLI